MCIVVACALIILICLSSVLSVKLSGCARWNKTGITVAAHIDWDNFTDQVEKPQSIFILNRTNVLYVADSGNSTQILMIPLDQQPIIATIVLTLETDPEQIYVDDDEDGPTIYVTLPLVDRVEKWMHGASSGIQIGEGCCGVAVDNEKNVYTTSWQGCVYKWSPQTNITTIVAGGIFQTGGADKFLSYPLGIHVDRTTDSVYVADHRNNRIQKWAKNAKKGITVAGASIGIPGSHSAALRAPYDVLVDDESHIVYVADTDNHRIQRWLPNARTGDTIATGSGAGGDADQLHHPQDLAFDKEGNLYVCDTGNRRVQKFVLIDNQPCPIRSTTNAEILSTTTTAPLKSRAVASHWHRYNKATIMIGTFSIVFWIIKMQL